MDAARITVVGHVVTDGGSRLEIAVDDRHEYDKLPLRDRKRTLPKGDPTTLVIDSDECEARLHNYPNANDRYGYSFYIGPRSKLLGLLRKAGLAEEGTKVKLEFITIDVPYRVKITKA